MKRPHGFTFIELLVVLALLGLLAGGAMAVGDVVTRRAQEQDLKRALREIRTALDSYKALADSGRLRKAAGDSGYPRTLSDLVDGVPDLMAPSGTPIYVMRRLPRDPFADPTLPAAATWGLRSYESPPDRPWPGRDVFDVYSRASGSGLDGQPYASW